MTWRSGVETQPRPLRMDARWRSLKHIELKSLTVNLPLKRKILSLSIVSLPRTSCPR